MEVLGTTRDMTLDPDTSAGMDETSHVLGGEFHSMGLVTSGMCSASLMLALIWDQTPNPRDREATKSITNNIPNRKPTSEMEIKRTTPTRRQTVALQDASHW